MADEHKPLIPDYVSNVVTKVPIGSAGQNMDVFIQQRIH